MKVLIALSTLLTVSTCGLIHHDHDDHKATSYQNIHIEHFHSVPTYVKKEDSHLLEHPISKGQTSSKVEVHHGGKHDHGYAIADSETNLHHHEGHDFSSSLGGDYHSSLASGGLEGHGYESHGHLISEDEHGSHGHLSLGNEYEGVGHGYAVAEGGHDSSLGQAAYAHQDEVSSHQETPSGHEGVSQYHGYTDGDIGGHEGAGLGHYQ